MAPCGVRASPACTRSVSSGRARPCAPAASHTASMTRLGAYSSWIRLLPSHRASRAGSRRTSSGQTTRVRPVSSAESISCTDTSKLTAVNWATRRPGPPGSSRSCQSSRLSRAPEGMTTPLGRPVDPEV
ncbi:hypothetical protein SGLAM104S_01428 [Streptomyces glaucescens]